MRIALDAMGGDHAPGPIVAGAVEAVRDRDDLTVLLVGDKPRLEAELAKHADAHLDPSALVRIEYGPIRRGRGEADAECA